jgi:hypothetical protein
MSQVSARYINSFIHCGTHWTDTWDCMCDDDCPVCHAEIEPYASEEIDVEGNVTGTTWHVDRNTWVPEGGWPEAFQMELLNEV